ncbi:hypothetical protein ACIBHX_07070 [Nonomuraea sp. NPDC050536]|uniref:hypothetical protein n=1 Tax=Nonomuraea sp. NPDC050536 TaxID=3364366 RepID=UPI0037C52122
MLRSIAIAALAAGAFLAASSTAASAATWGEQQPGGEENITCTAAVVCPLLNDALNRNNILAVAVQDNQLNLLTNESANVSEGHDNESE